MLEQTALPGPLFEPGPGWGKRLGRWIKNKGVSRIFPILALATLLAGIAKVYSRPENSEKITPELSIADQSIRSEEITATVLKGDGVIAVSRRALASYLQKFPDIQLKPEERLQIENYFKTKFQGRIFSAGEEIKFLVSDFRQAIDEALRLSEEQRQKLRVYLN